MECSGGRPTSGVSATVEQRLYSVLAAVQLIDIQTMRNTSSMNVLCDLFKGGGSVARLHPTACAKQYTKCVGFGSVTGHHLTVFHFECKYIICSADCLIKPFLFLCSKRKEITHSRYTHETRNLSYC